jgi:retinol-binding protein 3
MRQVTEQFGVWVPSSRAVNPVTGTNWEETGVRPDVPVPASEALRAAHLRALKRLLTAEHDSERRMLLQRALEEIQS